MTSYMKSFLPNEETYLLTDPDSHEASIVEEEIRNESLNRIKRQKSIVYGSIFLGLISLILLIAASTDKKGNGQTDKLFNQPQAIYVPNLPVNSISSSNSIPKGYQISVPSVSMTEAPYTQSPFTPSPNTPSPFTPSPFTPSPFTPSPFTPSPFTPSPFTPSPFTPSPFTSSPFTPSPFTHSPFTHNPFTEAPFTHNPITNTPFTDSPHTGSPHLLKEVHHDELKNNQNNVDETSILNENDLSSHIILPNSDNNANNNVNSKVINDISSPIDASAFISESKETDQNKNTNVTPNEKSLDSMEEFIDKENVQSISTNK